MPANAVQALLFGALLTLFTAQAVQADDLPIAGSLELADSEIVPIDLEPPLIDHEALISGQAGEVQTFSALVRDERGVESVQFFFRMGTSGDFASIPMRLIPGTSNFVVTIETSAQHELIEYYIEARDTGGNRVLKGFPSRPLVRDLSAPAGVTPASPVVDAPPAESGRPNWLYVLLGVAAVGLLLSQGDSGGGGEPSVPTVPLTITATQP
jgi:hypothetical protein